MNNQKKIFMYILALLTLVLIFIPFITTFNDVLTRGAMRFDYNSIIRKNVIPWIVRMVGVVLYLFGFKPSISGDFLVIGGEKPFLIEIAWNCIGWQSLLFFVMTSWVGLQGEKYSLISKIKSWLLGVMGTFLVNLTRILIVVMVSYYFNQKLALIVHDYGSTFLVVGWLMFFWWFSYRFVLEEKIVKN